MAVKGTLKDPTTNESLYPVTFYDQVRSADGTTRLDQDLEQISSDLTELKHNTKLGNGVDIASYTSTNKYTCTTDGYVYVSSASLSSGKVWLVVSDTNNVGLTYIYMPIVSAYQVQSLYIKKGMKLHLNDITSGAEAKFIPLQ